MGRSREHLEPRARDAVSDDAAVPGRADQVQFPGQDQWFVDDVNLARYTGYTRNRSIWQLVDALDSIERPPRPAPVFERP